MAISLWEFLHGTTRSGKQRLSSGNAKSDGELTSQREANASLR
ncbi:hypothetical protein [Coleofasciculus sp. FACHB-SPT9]|nr:hypothetical protein [Coleofasciculus sp. FACHB-SPT9]